MYIVTVVPREDFGLSFNKAYVSETEARNHVMDYINKPGIQACYCVYINTDWRQGETGCTMYQSALKDYSGA